MSMSCCSRRLPASGRIHLAASVEAGKHVFCEKPISTDPPGVRSVLASVDKAKTKNLSLVAGFCWRYNNMILDTFKQVHRWRDRQGRGLLRHLLHESGEADAAREHAARPA